MRIFFGPTRFFALLALLALGVSATEASAQAVENETALKLFAPDQEVLALERARSLARAGRLADAERELRVLLVLHPGNFAALYELGSVLQREGKTKESLAIYTEAARGSRPGSEDLRVVALDYVLLGDYLDAVRWLEQSVADDPSNARAWYDLGRACMMQEDFAGAEKALRRSLELLKDTRDDSDATGPALAVKAENNLGLTYEAQGRSSDAAAVYEIAVARQRSFALPSEQPLLNYGKLLIDLNQSEKAVGMLREATRIAPNDPKCHEQLARALDRAASEGVPGDDPESAEKEMLEAIRLDPKNARLHFQLGLMYRRTGKAELARKEMALSGELYGARSSPADR